MTDVWYAIGDCFYWSFKIMRKLAMTPNLIFITLGSIFFLYWMFLQYKYNRQAEESGSLK